MSRYLKSSSALCLAELSQSPLKDIANAYCTTEKRLFDKFSSDPLDLNRGYFTCDVVLSMELKQKELDQVNSSFGIGSFARSIMGETLQLDTLGLQARIGYFCAAAKVAQSQSDNPACYAANPTNYVAIRQNIFAEKETALDFAKLRCDINIASFNTIPALVMEVANTQLNLAGLTAPDKTSFQKKYDFDKMQIEIAYR